MESFVNLKSALFLVLRILFLTVQYAQYYDQDYLEEKNRKYIESKAEQVHFEFILAALKVLKYSIPISQIMYLPLVLLYFKYPKIARVYFVYEIGINLQ